MTDALRSQLESSLGNRYTIERELAGGGGIARVFLAHETALSRRVVIKVLSAELAAGLSAKRFEREIRLAASLQQANIVPLLAADQAADVPYYAMPFVEGLSLRQRLDRGGLVTLDQTIAILRDVARALAYAHDHGVVHRDIKPDNVLLSGDAAVVTDFGIAKAISAASAREGEDARPPNASTVTQAGTAVGTPSYMAPEQMSGDPSIDHRADLYSFGCLAYELLTGQPPFRGSFQALFAAHLSEPAARVSERNPDCPPSLAHVVMRCLEKDPAARPQSAREILRTLDGVMAPATGIARFRQRLSRRQRAAAAALLVMVALGVAVTLTRGRRSSAVSPIQTASVAVLPFFNASGDSTNEYLADGIADELATALGKVPRVRVISRSLSYRFKGQRVLDVRQIGRDLDCDHLLQGTVSRVPGGLRISAQLVSTVDNHEKWSESYVRGIGDALAFQDSITQAIAQALHRQLAGDSGSVPIEQLANRTTSNSQAYDLYLRGRFLLLRRGPGVRQAVEKFEEAIALDSNFARAHGGLALALQLMPYFEPVDAASLRERTLIAAERALRSDSTLAEAHTARAMAHQHAYQWQRADSAYQRATAIDSSGADTHIQYGRLLFYTGRFADAQREFERARALDPYSAVASGWVGHLLTLSGRQADGLAELRRALEIDSTNPPLLVMVTQALLADGRHEEALLTSDRLWRTFPPWRPVAAQLLATLGDRERALQLIRAMEAERPAPLTNTALVTLHLSVGDTARALDALERATDAAEIWPTYFSLSEPFFDPLRRNARFAGIIRRVGLNDSVFTSPNGGRPQ